MVLCVRAISDRPRASMRIRVRSGPQQHPAPCLKGKSLESAQLYDKEGRCIRRHVVAHSSRCPGSGTWSPHARSHFCAETRPCSSSCLACDHCQSGRIDHVPSEVSERNQSCGCDGCTSPAFDDDVCLAKIPSGPKSVGFDATSFSLACRFSHREGAQELLATYNRIPNACQTTNRHTTADASRGDSDKDGALLCHEIVAVVQSTEPGHGDHSVRWTGTSDRRAVRRSLLLQAEMRPVVMIVADVLGHQPFEMPFVEHNHVVEHVPAAATDEAFCHAILPWTSEAGFLLLDADALDRADDLAAEVHRTVEDQVFRLHVIRKLLPQSLAYPRAGSDAE